AAAYTSDIHPSPLHDALPILPKKLYLMILKLEKLPWIWIMNHRKKFWIGEWIYSASGWYLLPRFSAIRWPFWIWLTKSIPRSMCLRLIQDAFRKKRFHL